MSEDRPRYGSNFLRSEFVPHAIAELESVLRRMQEEAKAKPCRELSLAITRLEKCLMWLRRVA